jgi:hypothetical protein
MPRLAPLVSSLALAAPLTLSAAAAAETVSLSFRPLYQTSGVGAIVEVDIIASSDGPNDQPIYAIDAILDWDPAYLELIGNDDSNADYSWFVTGFLNDPDDINDDLTDGDALFTALAQAGNPAQVPPPPGMIVTTLQFEALQETALTTLSYVESLGDFGQTRVLYEPGQDVTGDISAVAEIRICTFPGCTSDLDGDCDVDQADLGELLSHYNQTDGGDLDGDGDTDQADLGQLLSEYGNVCY